MDDGNPLDDFCIFILTNGRPDRVFTYKTLRETGYTGKIYLVIDDEDTQVQEYHKIYGNEVLVFSKEEIGKTFDHGDNFNDRRTITYARNACRHLAEELCIKYYMQLDDDYMDFQLRYDENGQPGFVGSIHTMDKVLELMLEFFKKIPAKTIAMSQGGDHIGGVSGTMPSLRRKAMNSFLCSVNRPFKFVGTGNEDVNTYTSEGMRGSLFFTVMQAQLVQKPTQASSGGITEFYLEHGTYMKSFYTIMYAPSCTRIGVLGDSRSPHYRLHHSIAWENAVPKILHSKYKKAG